ncbi:hypothetical protein [Roseateles sp. LYH14W]|uniref:Uncharacterized protein n=1 Tax=Pelomonas parva TaxID=3299032 RepID=A0ABW7F5C3_9BURK
MSIRLASTLALAILTTAAQAQNIAGDLKACRQLADAARRLACYDAVALPTAPAVVAPAAAPAAVVDPAAKFGQESVRTPAAAAELKRIESRIRGRFQGWGPNKRIELENGQVWRIADDSEALYDLQDPKAIVHRGVLGAYFLEIEGVPFQARVVRAR